MDTFKNAVRATLEAAGFRPALLHTAEQKLVGVELHRVAAGAVARPGFYEVSCATSGQPAATATFLVLNPKDVVQREHTQGRWYEPEEMDIMRRHYHGGTFVDIGANVGNHTVYAAIALAAPQVIAIEPNPGAYRILRCNIALNQLNDRVRHVAIGLSDAPGRGSMDMRDPNNLGMVRIVPAEDGGLELATGDSLLANELHVGFIKVDVERLEMHVLHGLRQTIARHRPRMFVEVDDLNRPSFLQFIEDSGYELTETCARYPGLANYCLAPL